MHLLAISLLAILAGTLLLIKIKKDGLGKFFAFVSWFFIVVGFILFIGFIAGAICDMSHGGKIGQPGCCQEMMMKDSNQGMHGGMCCPADKGSCVNKGFQGMHDGKCCASGPGACVNMGKCMQHDSTMKTCPGHLKDDTSHMSCPKTMHQEITE